MNLSCEPGHAIHDSWICRGFRLFCEIRCWKGLGYVIISDKLCTTYCGSFIGYPDMFVQWIRLTEIIAKRSRGRNIISCYQTLKRMQRFGLSVVFLSNLIYAGRYRWPTSSDWGLHVSDSSVAHGDKHDDFFYVERKHQSVTRRILGVFEIDHYRLEKHMGNNILWWNPLPSIWVSFRLSNYQRGVMTQLEYKSFRKPLRPLYVKDTEHLSVWGFYLICDVNKVRSLWAMFSE